jgi:hypothetical protein
VSKEELVDAYIDGRISRRTFVRRLVATGVSLGAALTYASVLAVESRADAKNAGKGQGGGGNDGAGGEGRGDRSVYGGHSNLRIPFERTVKNPCNGERVRISGMVLLVSNVTITKSGRFSATFHRNYSNLVGVGLDSGDEYRGGGTARSTQNGFLGSLYPATSSEREMLTLAGRGRNRFRITTHLHMTIDANGRVHAVFGKIDEVDCLG